MTNRSSVPDENQSRRAVLQTSAFGIASFAGVGRTCFKESKNEPSSDETGADTHQAEAGGGDVLLSCPLMTSDLVHKSMQE